MSSFEKLESEVNTLKSNLSESNTSRSKLVVGKSKVDEILRAQIIGKKNYGLGYAYGWSNHTDSPGVSSVSIATTDVRAKVIKKGKKHQGLRFANMNQHQL